MSNTEDYDDEWKEPNYEFIFLVKEKNSKIIIIYFCINF